MAPTWPPRQLPERRRARRGSRGPWRPVRRTGGRDCRLSCVLPRDLDAREGGILSGHYTRSSVSAGPSLYRRHRPRTFADVVGQEHVVRTLSNAVEQGRVHHAYLFVGSRGTGKTSMAKILAASLNCQNGGPTVTPCGKCESCVSIAAATSPGRGEIDAAADKSVGRNRHLRERRGYAAGGGRHQVFNLDEAHMLTKAALKAFFKTLEEPPPQTI